jgi:hypothetical protein
MMRIILITFALILNLFANSSEIEVKIYENILSNFNTNSKIKVYSDNKNISNIIKMYSNKLEISNKIDAKFYILSSKIDSLSSDKIVIVTSYNLLKDMKSSIGAFYWKKGRPNILFIQERLKNKNLILNSSYNKYIEIERCLYEICF